MSAEFSSRSTHQKDLSPSEPENSAENPNKESTIAPDALGLGLRPPLYSYLFEHWPDVDYFH